MESLKQKTKPTMIHHKKIILTQHNSDELRFVYEDPLMCPKYLQVYHTKSMYLKMQNKLSALDLRRALTKLMDLCTE